MIIICKPASQNGRNGEQEENTGELDECGGEPVLRALNYGMKIVGE